jgi:tRNA threonylcarbamoyladenosine biosynthesis protein TsaB
LRIGVSVAKGFCLAGNKPLISIPTLTSLANAAVANAMDKNADHLFCPMIDARRMEVYCALFSGNLELFKETSAVVVTADMFAEFKMKKIFFFGDGAEKCRSVLADNFEFIPGIVASAKNMAVAALTKFQQKEFENLAAFEPFYLKEYQAGPKGM